LHITQKFIPSRKSNIICNHIIIKAQEKKLEYVNLIIDFHVRWNTTFLMLNRFIKFKEIINNITLEPEKIDGITKQNINKLKKLNLSNPEWELIDTLTKILKPFYSATKLLSAKNYPTLSIGIVIKSLLNNFLPNAQEEYDALQNQVEIAELLQEQLTYHFDTKLSVSQRNHMLVINP
jgi:hypothetical protein